MAFGTRVQFDAVREAAFGSITSGYVAVGPALTDHCRLVRMVNATDAEVYVSLDGSTNNIRMARSSFILLDLSTNRIQDDGLFIAQGTTFYVKYVSAAPTVRSFWIEVISATGGV